MTGVIAWAAAWAVGGGAWAGADSADLRHHAVVHKTVGFYAVYPPPDYDAKDQKATAFPLCVILHGRGRTEADHAALVKSLGRDGMIYVAPRAPYLHLRTYLKKRRIGYTALPPFPEAWGGKHEASFPKEEVEALEVEKLYTEWIAECVQDVRRRYRIQPGRVMVIGHSEGAEFAHQFAMDHPELIRGYVAYAGYFHEDIMATEACAIHLKQHRIVPWIGHSERDPYVPAATSKGFVKYLERWEVPHEKAFVRERNHEISSAILPALRRFLRSDAP